MRALVQAVAIGFLQAATGPALADDASDIAAAQAFAAPATTGTCKFVTGAPDDFAQANQVFRLTYRIPGQDEDEADKTFTLIQLFCTATPRQASFVYVARKPDTSTLALLSFAEPRLDYDYADENFSRLKAPPKISGYATRTQLWGSAYDPASRSISMKALWSDRGDAWSAGRWDFINGEFVLKQFIVDPTFDAKAPAAADDHAGPSRYEIYPELRPETK